MANKKFKLGILTTVMALLMGMLFVSCFSGPTVAVDRSMMDNSVSVDEQSRILISGRITLNTDRGEVIAANRGFIHPYDLGTVYILPAGEHTFIGEYTFFKSQVLPGRSYRTLTPAGTIPFNITHNFLPGQFYYLVGVDNPEEVPTSIRILTEEEVNPKNWQYINLKSARSAAEKQIK